jgi:hypothetical protein
VQDEEGHWVWLAQLAQEVKLQVEPVPMPHLVLHDPLEQGAGGAGAGRRFLEKKAVRNLLKISCADGSGLSPKPKLGRKT